jgi:hypothetical protein
MTPNYKADWAVENKELEELLKQRERLDLEIAKKRFRIAALVMLSEDNEELDQVVGMTLGGLTDACRTAFMGSYPKALSPTEVKVQLKALGFPVEHYKNAMAAIHTVISRLFDAREIVPVKTATDETGYQWRLRTPHNLVPMNTDGTTYRKIGVDPQANSAYSSGMRGKEKPPKK